MIDHVETVKEYAAIARGEHPGWKGDSVANRDHFAFRIGLRSPDEAADLIRSLGIAESQYVLLTGLPPGSLRRMSADIKRGMRAASERQGDRHGYE